jgi:hypothetical protein
VPVTYHRSDTASFRSHRLTQSRKVSMFRAVEPYLLVSDSGIEVSRKDRNAMQYRDGDHVLSLYCDTTVADDGRFGAAILLPLDLHWDPPFERERIDLAARATIEKNLLESWGVVDYLVTIES